MGAEIEDSDAGLSEMFPHERDRLVHLCARLSGSIDAAEDLAQETLIQAWRSRDSLRDPQRRDAWLSGIAQNVCRRWARRSGREGSRRIELTDQGTRVELDEWLADDFDLEVELERGELAGLLHRALELLPVETRVALIQSYIQELPQAEVASQLGVSEGAIRVRLHRGKLALRRILATDLGGEAAAYGLILPDGSWQDTGSWCFACGRHRLLGRFDAGSREITIRCPSCSIEGMVIAHSPHGAGVGSFTGFKRFLARQMRYAESECRRALKQGTGRCPWCAHVNPVHLVLSDDVPPPARGLHGLHIRCSSCGSTVNQLLAGLALSHSEVQRFQREQKRMRLLLEREIEVDGQRVIVTSFESLTGAARIDVLSAVDTFDVLSVQQPLRVAAVVTTSRAH